MQPAHLARAAGNDAVAQPSDRERVASAPRRRGDRSLSARRHSHPRSGPASTSGPRRLVRRGYWRAPGSELLGSKEGSSQGKFPGATALLSPRLLDRGGAKPISPREATAEAARSAIAPT